VKNQEKMSESPPPPEKIPVIVKGYGAIKNENFKAKVKIF